MNQSEFGARTCSQLRVRENARESSYVLLKMRPDWLNRHRVSSDWLKQITGRAFAPVVAFS